jgi:hypothetical protein
VDKLSSLVDRKAFNRFNVLDRKFNCRFDSFREFERENGYRHPPLYIVIIIHSGAREEEKAENCMKNTHVQRLN